MICSWVQPAVEAFAWLHLIYSLSGASAQKLQKGVRAAHYVIECPGTHLQGGLYGDEEICTGIQGIRTQGQCH